MNLIEYGSPPGRHQATNPQGLGMAKPDADSITVDDNDKAGGRHTLGHDDRSQVVVRRTTTSRCHR